MIALEKGLITEQNGSRKKEHLGLRMVQKDEISKSEVA